MNIFRLESLASAGNGEYWDLRSTGGWSSLMHTRDQVGANNSAAFRRFGRKDCTRRFALRRRASRDKLLGMPTEWMNTGG
jgi:hypothetical protein